MNPLSLALGLISLCYLIVTFLLWYLTPRSRLDRKAAVVVLGDLGHSPRMCFHALSIVKVGCPVDLIGYEDSDLMDEIKENALIRVIGLPKPVRKTGQSYFSYALGRVWRENVTLHRALKLSDPTVVMVQNPPSIPTLGVARYFTLWSSPGCKLVIDWHNLGYSILAMSQKGWMVKLYRAYETIFGRVAYLHLAVSVRLGMALKSNLGINPKRIIPLYDRPTKQRLVKDKALSRAKFPEYDADAAWVVTSTSYTPDEDIRMLIKALEKYTEGPRIECIITGKGPMKAEIEQEIRDSKFPNAKIHTSWLSYEDYHTLLGVSDLGISLHKSSSGWDLPMKVVDMFGAGLPVLALDYSALKELVKPSNGLTFTDMASLIEGLKVLQDAWKLSDLKKGAIAESQNLWEQQWNLKVGPIFGYGQYTGEESSSDSSGDE